MARSTLVSVLMPTHDSERYIAAAIESILEQTLQAFELIVVDDGSTDGTAAILDRYRKLDSRVRVVRQENQGIPATRNKCLELATGVFFAWMDSDDISLSTRLEKQVNFMEAHQDIGVSGTWAKTIGSATGTLARYPVDDGSLRSMLIFNPPFVNTSTIVRRVALQAAHLRFDIAYAQSQDYDLWERMAQYTRLANLPEVLVLYRVHPRQVTQTRSRQQVGFSGQVTPRQLARLGIVSTQEEFELHQRLAQFDLEATREANNRAEIWLRRLYEANQTKGVFPRREFAQIVGQRWFLTCRGTTQLGHWAWKKYWSSPLSRFYEMPRRTKAKFLLFSTAKLRS